MSPVATRSPAAAPPHRGSALLPAAGIVLAALAAWFNSLSAPFIFDDEAVITANPTIRHLWTALAPPAVSGPGVAGRPLVNFSLALNYALGGLDVRGYHLLNLAIHVLAALTLFGIVRRTLLRMEGDGRPDPAGATWWGFAAALVWAVHPLVTETVTCVVQRTESIVSLCYLLTLFCFIRGVDASGNQPSRDEDGAKPAATGWFALAVLACLSGMASKEVMVTAPLVVLLYDRAFVAGTFAAAWHRRRVLYLGYAATWILLGYLVLSTGAERGGTVGFGLGVSAWSYALTQCRALTLYLRLALWPHPLVVDYGTAVVSSVAAVWWRGLIVWALLGATGWALVRRPGMGFLGAVFFLILAPSSSVLPLVTQTIAEHRMYLPLAVVVTAGMVAARRWLGRAGLAALLVVAAPLGWLTHRRNADYRTAVSIWRDAVAKVPGNPRAHGNLGNALVAAGRYEEAVTQYHDALRLQPDYIQADNNLGDALLQLHRPLEAVAALMDALRLFPANPDAHHNLGNADVQLGRFEDAIREYEAALRVQPDAADTQRALAAARFDWANALAQQGRFADAVTQFREVVRRDPGNLRALVNLGNALLMLGRPDEAIAAYQEALRLRPDDPKIKENLDVARSLREQAAPSR